MVATRLQPARQSKTRRSIKVLGILIQNSRAKAQRKTPKKANGLFFAPLRLCARNKPPDSKTQLHPKLKLTRVECLRWLSKRRQRSRPSPERVVRNSKIRTVQNVETFRKQLQVDALGKLKPLAHT